MSQTSDQEIAAWLRLIECPGVTAEGARALLAALGPPTEIFGARVTLLSRIVGAEIARSLHRPASADLTARIAATQAWAQADGHTFVSLGDDSYPQQLLQIPDPPLVLYVEGDLAALAEPLLGVLLSRQSTQEGLRDAIRFSRALAARGLRLALDRACASLLPELDEGLAGRILWVSRVCPKLRGPKETLGQPEPRSTVAFTQHPGAQRLRGPSRGPHRLLAGLSRALLVVQAARRSEVFDTARFAAELGRDVFAIPGSIHSPLSKASHQLIKDGAKLVESADDVSNELSGFAVAKRD